MNKIVRCTTMSACFIPRFSSLCLQPKLLPVQCLLTSNQFQANFSTSKLSLNTTKIKSEVPLAEQEERKIMTEYKKRLKDQQTELFKQKLKAKTKQDENYISKVIAKALMIGLGLSLSCCILYAIYDPAYRRSTQTKFPLVYWISGHFVEEEEIVLQEKDVNVKAAEFRSAFLDDKDQILN